MGMFDEIRCKYPLPELREQAQGLLYQTKDTGAQWLDQYEIREDGTLWHEDYDIEDRSNKSAEPGSLASVAGIMTRVNQRWEPEPITGEIRFYNRLSESGGWVEWSSYFVDGHLKQLHLIRYDPIADTQTLFTPNPKP